MADTYPSAPALPHVDIDLGADVALESIGPAAILSPDGRRVVVVSKNDGEPSRLFTKLLDQPKLVELPGTEDAYAPFFSPDGNWIGFFTNGKLKKTRVDGSQRTTLCDASIGRGGTWSDDGSFIIAALDTQRGLARIAADGGVPTPFTTLKGEERSHRWPMVVPGSNRVLFIANHAAGNFAESDIAVATLPQSTNAASDHTVLIQNGGMYPRYLTRGYLTVVNKGTLHASVFNAARLTLGVHQRPYSSRCRTIRISAMCNWMSRAVGRSCITKEEASDCEQSVGSTPRAISKRC